MCGRLFGCLAVCVGLLATGTLQAHHALAALYDMQNEETVSGTVVQIRYLTPHGSLTMSVSNADGTTTERVFTTVSASSLERRGVGVTSTLLKAGDRITAKVFPARRNNPAGGFLKSITTADGTTIEIASSTTVI